MATAHEKQVAAAEAAAGESADAAERARKARASAAGASLGARSEAPVGRRAAPTKETTAAVDPAESVESAPLDTKPSTRKP